MEGESKNVMFYFHVHQPTRLRTYRVFDIGNSHSYFDDEKNREIMKKVAKKSYFPMNKLLLEKLQEDKMKVSFSITGMFLDQAAEYEPKLIDSFQELAETGNVEMINETYFHSLSWLKSKKEFKTQVNMQKKKIKNLFHYKTKTFRNTELVYTNELAKDVEEMGYKNILAEGVDKVMGWKSPNYRYKAKDSNINLYLKNYRLSDDIAFRFSNKEWEEYPLGAEKYATWLSTQPGEIINLFMDYETFGEHQWADSGIFKFMKNIPKAAEKKGIGFMTPTEATRKLKSRSEIDVPYLTSWADTERDVSAWLGNKIQQSAFDEIYNIEEEILKTNDEKIIEDWRKLQASDHLYYMCTKWFADGDVHKYFNPYDSPYDSFINAMNVLNDLILRCKIKGEKNGSM